MVEVPVNKADWVIRDVPESTRHKIKGYAGSKGMTLAQALDAIIDKALLYEATERDNGAPVEAARVSREEDAGEESTERTFHLPARVFSKTASREEVEEAQRQLKEFLENALQTGGAEE